MRRIICILSMLLCTCCSFTALANEYTTAAIDAICAKYGFANNKFWVGWADGTLDNLGLPYPTSGFTATDLPNGYKKERNKSGRPCTYTSNGSKTPTTLGEGYYGYRYPNRDCEECNAFALFLGSQLSGVADPDPKYNKKNGWIKYTTVEQVNATGGVRVGDIIRTQNGKKQHSALVYKLEGNGQFRVIECEGGVNNRIYKNVYYSENNTRCKTLEGIDKTLKLAYVLRARDNTGAEVNIEETELLLEKGNNEGLRLFTSPENLTVKWTSSNNKVAVVDEYGEVTGVGYGTATITCTAQDGSDRKDTCTVIVSEAVIYCEQCDNDRPAQYYTTENGHGLTCKTCGYKSELWQHTATCNNRRTCLECGYTTKNDIRAFNHSKDRTYEQQANAHSITCTACNLIIDYQLHSADCPSDICVCGAKVIDSNQIRHNYNGNEKCITCKKKAPEESSLECSEHRYGEATEDPEFPYAHVFSCPSCEDKLYYEHFDSCRDSDVKCDHCGANTDTLLHQTYKTVINPENPKTHLYVCEDCGESFREEGHYIDCRHADGQCSSCGASFKSLDQDSIKHDGYAGHSGENETVFPDPFDPTRHRYYCWTNWAEIVFYEPHFPRFERDGQWFCICGVLCTDIENENPLCDYYHISLSQYNPKLSLDSIVSTPDEIYPQFHYLVCPLCGDKIISEHTAFCFNPDVCVLCGKHYDIEELHDYVQGSCIYCGNEDEEVGILVSTLQELENMARIHMPALVIPGIVNLGEVYLRFEEKPTAAHNTIVYDIRLVDSNGNEVPLPGECTLCLPYPDGFHSQNVYENRFFIRHFTKDGTETFSSDLGTLTAKSPGLCITISSLSPFEITWEDTLSAGQLPPETGDTSHLEWYLLALSVAIVGIILTMRKREIQ